MADVQSQSHSGIRCGPDPREGRDFFVRAFGSEPHGWTGLNTDDLIHARSPHPCVIAEDFLFVTFPQGRPEDLTGPQPSRGIGSARHAFSVPRGNFAAMLEHLNSEGIEFEGPMAHPENGPLGESVYFTDPLGNHFEVCWRRDEDEAYDPVLVGYD